MIQEVVKYKIQYSHDKGKTWQDHFIDLDYNEAMAIAGRIDDNYGNIKYRVTQDHNNPVLSQFKTETCKKCHRPIIERYTIQYWNNGNWLTQFNTLMDHTSAHAIKNQCEKISKNQKWRVVYAN